MADNNTGNTNPNSTPSWLHSLTGRSRGTGTSSSSNPGSRPPTPKPAATPTTPFSSSSQKNKNTSTTTDLQTDYFSHTHHNPPHHPHSSSSERPSPSPSPSPNTPDLPLPQQQSQSRAHHHHHHSHHNPHHGHYHSHHTHRPSAASALRHVSSLLNLSLGGSGSKCSSSPPEEVGVGYGSEPVVCEVRRGSGSGCGSGSEARKGCDGRNRVDGRKGMDGRKASSSGLSGLLSLGGGKKGGTKSGQGLGLEGQNGEEEAVGLNKNANGGESGNKRKDDGEDVIGVDGIREDEDEEEEKKEKKKATALPLSLLLPMKRKVRGPQSLAMLPLTDVDDGEEEESFSFGFGLFGRGFDGREDGKGKWKENGVEGHDAWHNPNLVQMVETLRVVMMQKRDALEGLPASCNSYVLSLLEGFSHLVDAQRASDRKLADLNKLREKELEEFRGMSEEWIERENAYKAEIKRLELLLLKESKDGMACVAVARSGSVVDRSGSKRFRERIQKANNRENQDTTSNKAAATPHDARGPRHTRGPLVLDPHNDVLVSQLVELREREERRFVHPYARQRSAAIHLRPHGGYTSQNILQENTGGEQASNHPRDWETLANIQPRHKQAPRKASYGDALHSRFGNLPLFRHEQSSDGDTSSSDSGGSTETPEGGFETESLAQLRPQPELVNVQVPPQDNNNGWSARDIPNGREYPALHLRPPNEHNESSTHGQDSRRYSFIEGDDEVLTLSPSPSTSSWSSKTGMKGGQGKYEERDDPWDTWLRSMEEREAPYHVENRPDGVGVTDGESVWPSGDAVYVPVDTEPSPRMEFGSVPLSTSSGSVRWVGSVSGSNSNGLGVNTSGSAARYGQEADYFTENAGSE